MFNLFSFSEFSSLSRAETKVSFQSPSSKDIECLCSLAYGDACAASPCRTSSLSLAYTWAPQYFRRKYLQFSDRWHYKSNPNSPENHPVLVSIQNDPFLLSSVSNHQTAYTHPQPTPRACLFTHQNLTPQLPRETRSHRAETSSMLPYLKNLCPSIFLFSPGEARGDCLREKNKNTYEWSSKLLLSA